MINVDEVKKFVDSISNKEQSGDTYTVDQFNLWLRRAMDAIFKKEYGLPEDYQPGAPLPRISYELTQKIKDDLRVFKEKPVIALDAQAEMLIPSDYVHYTAIRYRKIINQESGDPIVKLRGVEVIDDDKWASRSDHSVKGPTLDYPICKFNNDNIEYLPLPEGSQIQFEYLRYPKTPKWAFTVTNGVEVYDANNSIDIELPEILTNDISWMILTYIGARNNDPIVSQKSESVKNTGV